MMNELEKILKEVEQLQDIQGWDQVTVQEILEIIRKHTKTSWTPVECKLPPVEQRLLATIKHHEWIADYDSGWVPDIKKTRYPEYTEVCEITYNGKWNYISKDNEISEVQINPQKDISKAIDEIIAWCPYPEPYRPE